MNMNVKNVKIIVNIPVSNLDEVRNVVCEAGAGIIGNYTNCSMSTKCIGTFKPNDKANPYIGEKEKMEFVEEEKLEVYKIESTQSKISIICKQKGEDVALQKLHEKLIP